MARTDRQPRQRLDAESRRAAILDAARTAFGERPYDQVSVAEIASAAGASEALVYRYFDGKAGLYVAATNEFVQQLAAEQEAADVALGAQASARERVRTSLRIYLEHVSRAGVGWAAPLLLTGGEPAAAIELRQQVRAAYVERLREVLLPDQGRRHEFALWGYFGFLDAACLTWVQRGCPDDEREPLTEAALGALEGALGDWGR